jgi:hypothetical protein
MRFQAVMLLNSSPWDYVSGDQERVVVVVVVLVVLKAGAAARINFI